MKSETILYLSLTNPLGSFVPQLPLSAAQLQEPIIFRTRANAISIEFNR